MIRCLIADDEQQSIDVVAHYVNQTDMLQLVATTTKASKVLSIVNEQKIDLLFQDIHMPDLTGIDIVKALNGKCEVIFITAYPQYAVDGFELGIADYLLKPVSYPRFIKAIQKTIEKIDQKKSGMSPEEDETAPDFVFVRTGLKDNVIKIMLREIDYIQGEGNYISIHHSNKKTITYMSMNEMIQSLPAKHFIRVHRSYIVPYQKIHKIDKKWILLLGNETKIPLGETFKSTLWQMIDNNTVG